jgi:cell volume regulation protein A
MADDILCIIGHEHDLPELGKLFSQAPMSNMDNWFFGDFILDANARLVDLAPVYGLSLQDCGAEATIGEFFNEKMGGKPVVGDQLEWQGFFWTVAAVEQGLIKKMGLKLAHKAA